jgi:hypothetical protein
MSVAGALSADVGQVDASRLADKRVLYVAAAVDENADLTSDLMGDPGEMAGEL